MKNVEMLAENFESGYLFINNNKIEIIELAWNAHPAFKGVFLKHIIKGEETKNAMSVHLVKIEPGCEIGIHNHIGKTELHEVIEGEGVCFVDSSEIKYETGIMAVMPADINHKVIAGEKGLFLLAKFFPALV